MPVCNADNLEAEFKDPWIKGKFASGILLDRQQINTMVKLMRLLKIRTQTDLLRHALLSLARQHADDLKRLV